MSLSPDHQAEMLELSAALAALARDGARLHADPMEWLQDFSALLAEADELLDQARASLLGPPRSLDPDLDPDLK